MKMKRILLLLLVLIPIVFSQTDVEVPPYITSLAKLFKIVWGKFPGNVSLSFFISLAFVAIVIFLIIYSSARRFLRFALGEGSEKEANTIAFFLSIAVTLLAFSNTSFIMGILVVSSIPLAVYFITALLFGAIMFFWYRERYWGIVTAVAFWGFVMIYSIGKVDVRSIDRVLGTNLAQTLGYQAPAWKVLNSMIPGAGSALGIVSLILAVISTVMGIIEAFTKGSKKSGGGS